MNSLIHHRALCQNLESFLFRAVREQNYTEALHLINTLPDFAAIEEEYWYDTLLHALLEVQLLDHGNFLDHIAFSFAETLVTISPSLVMKKNWLNNTPLMLSLRSSHKSSIGKDYSIMMISHCVESIIMKFPLFHHHGIDAILRDANQFHLACVEQCETEVLQFMLEIYPYLAVSFCKVHNYGEHTGPHHNPVMLLCKANKTPMDKIAAMLRSATKRTDTNPLFHCIVHQASQYLMESKTFKTIVSHFEDQVTMKDEYGDLPLHYALRGKFLAITSKEEVCKYQDAISRLLIAKYTASAKERDRFGMLPLEIALWNGSSDAVLVDLLNAFPESVAATSSLGLNHFAIASIAIKERNSAVNLSYVLLRMNPSVLNR